MKEQVYFISPSALDPENEDILKVKRIIRLIEWVFVIPIIGEEKYFELSKKMLNNNLSDSDNNFIIEKIWPIIKGQYDFYKLAITL